MSVNPNSFFLTYRKIFESDLWKRPLDFRLFLLILGNAVFSENGVEMNGVHVKRGQWLRSYRNLQKDLEYKEKRGYKQHGLATIKRSVNRLIENDSVTVRDTINGTLFEVVNYERYQGFGEVQDNANGTLIGTTSERHRNKNNNVNNDNNDIKTNNVRKKYTYEQHHFKLAELLFRNIKENNPNAREPNLESWANTFRLMMERPNEKRIGKDIQDLIIWSQKHHFWYKNILSADKLRKQFDTLYLQMKEDNAGPMEKFKIKSRQSGEVIPEWFKKKDIQNDQQVEYTQDELEAQAEMERLLSKYDQ